MYALDSSEIQMSRLRLQWSHKASAGAIPLKGTTVSLVRLPHDSRALDIQLRQSHEGRFSCSSVLIDVHEATLQQLILGQSPECRWCCPLGAMISPWRL